MKHSVFLDELVTILRINFFSLILQIVPLELHPLESRPFQETQVDGDQGKEES